MKLYEIIKKNLKVIARSKSSATIIFLGPLLIILLVGFAFSNSQAFSLRIGTYSPSYSELSEAMIKQLRGNNYNVMKFDTQTACTDGIKDGTVNACIVFPKDMKVSESANEITFHIDYAKMNLVYVLIDSMMNKIEATSSDISLDLTADLINKLNFAQTESKNNMIKIGNIIDQKKELESKIGSIESAVRSMDTTFKKEDFKQNDLNKNLGLLKEDIKVMNSALSNMPNEAKNRISNGQEMIPATTANYSEISAELRRASEAIDRLKSNVSSATSLLDKQVSEIGGIMANLDSTLEKTKKQLEGAQNAKTTTSDSINDMRRTITNMEIKIGEVKKSLTDVDSRISSIAVKEASTIVAPITTKIEPIVVEKSHFNYMFPTLIVLVIMTTAILFSSISTVVERNSKAYFRNSIAPVSKYLFEIGQFIAALMMILLQLLIFSIFAALFFKQSFLASIGTTALALILISAVFILIGMLAGNIFNTEETAILAAITMSSLFLFLSSTVLPLESLPEVVKQIAEFNPFVVSESLLRQTILYNLPLHRLGYPIFLLFDFIILIAILIIVVKRLKRQ